MLVRRLAASLSLIWALAAVACGDDGSGGSGGAGGSGAAATGGVGGGEAPGGSGGGGGAPVVEDVRGDRYCEVLVGNLAGSDVAVDVYNTYLLNDCPQAAWDALDANAIKQSEMADAIILNGPRYWLMDKFVNSMVADPTIHTFGDLDMRLAGTLVVPLSEVSGGEMPYVTRTVARTTSWVYLAGTSVYELRDPGGQVFVMQSYTTMKAPLTEGDLATLDTQLSLPADWVYQSRVLDADLVVTAIDSMATIVQDDLSNTYQLAQQ
ncbi:MAG: hypothetical protein U0271_09840 [Polyangiaceae bacterium]